jgi:hypothetical protein
MQPTIEILARISVNSNANKDVLLLTHDVRQ